MTKSISAVFILVLACLFSLPSVFPFVLGRSASAQTKPNVPLTFLGKPYRARWNSQGRPLASWTLAVTDHNDIDRDADPDRASAHEIQLTSSGRTMNTKPPILMPFPLVLSTSPESGPPRLRLIKSKRPMQHGSCVDDVPPSEKVQSGGMKGPEQLRSSGISQPERKQGLFEESMQIRRSKRLYDRGEWKSRLLKEY